MLKLFRQSGMPRRPPPRHPTCAADGRPEAPRIASPLRGVSYALRRRDPDDSARGECRRRRQPLFWFDGRALIGAQPASAGPFAWRPAEAGLHQVRVVDDRGRSAERDVDVQFAR